MIRTILAGALLCVLFASNADARPKHGHHYRSVPISSDLYRGVGCSDPVMRPCGAAIPLAVFGEEITRKSLRHRRLYAVNPSKEITHHNTVRAMPFGLRRVMSEGAGRAIGHRPRAWCGWQMRKWLGVANPAGNLARWWAGFGRPAHGPAVGTIVVWARGRGHGHVGIITGQTADGRWVVKSGNDGHAVRERPRSVSSAIAFRWPA